MANIISLGYSMGICAVLPVSLLCDDLVARDYLIDSEC